MKELKPQIFAIAYARVSAAKQAVYGESLELQAELLRNHTLAFGWTLFPDDEVILDPFTGTVDGRPGYQRALSLIRANPGKVKYFLVKTIDRFSRAGAV